MILIQLNLLHNEVNAGNLCLDRKKGKSLGEKNLFKMLQNPREKKLLIDLRCAVKHVDDELSEKLELTAEICVKTEA